MQPRSIQLSLCQAKADPSIAWARFIIGESFIMVVLNQSNESTYLCPECPQYCKY